MQRKERLQLTGGIMAKIKKDLINLDLTLVELKFIMKGKQQLITVYTTATASCNFVDWLNNNKALQSYKVNDKQEFSNKYFIFDDYKKKCTVCINRDEIKCFTIPFYMDTGNGEIDFKLLQMV